MSEGLPCGTGTFCVTPEAHAGIREWSYKGSGFHLCIRQNLLTMWTVKQQSWLPGRGQAVSSPSLQYWEKRQSLLSSVWLWEVTGIEEVPVQGLLPALTCKMSLLWDAPPVAKIFVLGTARKKKKTNGCDNSLKAEKAVFQSSSATKGLCWAHASYLSHRTGREIQSDSVSAVLSHIICLWGCCSTHFLLSLFFLNH